MTLSSLAILSSALKKTLFIGHNRLSFITDYACRLCRNVDYWWWLKTWLENIYGSEGNYTSVNIALSTFEE